MDAEFYKDGNQTGQTYGARLGTLHATVNPTCRRMPMTSSVDEWVDEVARTTHPDKVVWCDGSEAENERLISHMVSDNTLIRLNEQALPNCYLHRSHPQDVARTEHLTFICTDDPLDVGPTNNWMSPQDARD